MTASPIESAAISDMSLLTIFTARDSGFRRFPVQASQGWTVRYFSSSSRTQLESVSRYRRARFGIIPSNGLRVL